MNYFGGVILIILGIVILVYGDKKLNVKGGVVLKTFSPSNYPASLIKWVAGSVSVLAGISLLVKHF